MQFSTLFFCPLPALTPSFTIYSHYCMPSTMLQRATMFLTQTRRKIADVRTKETVGKSFVADEKKNIYV